MSRSWCNLFGRKDKRFNNNLHCNVSVNFSKGVQTRVRKPYSDLSFLFLTIAWAFSLFFSSLSSPFIEKDRQFFLNHNNIPRLMVFRSILRFMGFLSPFVRVFVLLLLGYKVFARSIDSSGGEWFCSFRWKLKTKQWRSEQNLLIRIIISYFLFVFLFCFGIEDGSVWKAIFFLLLLYVLECVLWIIIFDFSPFFKVLSCVIRTLMWFISLQHL